ncbi:FkbM family methyltransferase [Rickettsiales endosymbiont of Peranema trichophorum]
MVIRDGNGNNILVDFNDGGVSRILLQNREWERPIMNLLNKLVKPGDTIVTLGGHIGFHVVQMSKLTGKNGHVYCFEPNPYTLRFLKSNIILNDCDNVKVFDRAAYSQATTLRFAAKRYEGANTGGSYVIEGQDDVTSEAQEIQVKSVKLDDVLNDVQAINLLQMDIEGSEPEAVKGAVNLIARSPNLTVVQEWSVAMMSKHMDVRDYLEFWKSRGYQVAEIQVDGPKLLQDHELLADNALTDVVITKDLEALKKLYH